MYNNEEKRVFIINGVGSVGKDTFVKTVSHYIETSNYSSVNQIKHVANLLGWDGKKDLKSRKFLSDLKILSTEYNDFPYLDVTNRIHDFMFGMYNTDELLFIHIREPKEIIRVVDYCISKNIKVNTIIVTNSNKTNKTYGNMADDNVYEFYYDYVVDNCGDIDDLNVKARGFLNFFNIKFI